MSHSPLRTEADCLNCGAEVTVRYCPVCGQENIVPKQSVWGLITHFVFDIFHFDGKFFITVKHLFTRPGFIPKEYTSGRRMRYLDPIRMYLFTSAAFFLIFFALKIPTEGLLELDQGSRSLTKIERLQQASTLYTKKRSDSLSVAEEKQLSLLLDSTVSLRLQKAAGPDSDSNLRLRVGGEEFLLLTERTIPGDIEEGNPSNLNQKFREYKRRFGDDEVAMKADLVNTFVHKFPYLLFVSLPFFALILKLLYIRRKNFLYSDHAVFTLYQYIFTFLLFLAFFLLRRLGDWTDWKLFDIVSEFGLLSGGLYLLFSLKRFYGQRWKKTIVKFFLLNILAFIVLSLLMILFVTLAFFQL